MSQATLLAGSALSAVAAGVYMYVGRRFSQRRMAPAHKAVALVFAVWWIGFGVFSLTGAVATFLAAFDALPVDLYIALTYYNLMVLALALACLLYYLLFLFTGRKGVWKPLAVAYSAYLIFLIYFVRSHDPVGLDVQRWQVAIEYAEPLQEDPLFLVVVGLLVVPQVAASFAYLALAFRVDHRVLRYRIITVSSSLIVWFGSAFLASARGLSGTDAWQVASRLIGLGATLAILAAYYPPAPLRRRFGLVSIDEPLAD